MPKNSHLGTFTHKNLGAQRWMHSGEVSVEVLADVNSVHLERAQKSVADLAKTRGDLHAGLGNLLSDLQNRKEVKKKERQMVRDADCIHSDELTRASNRSWMLAFDQQLRTVSLSLLHFMVDVPLKEALLSPQSVASDGCLRVKLRDSTDFVLDFGSIDHQGRPTMHLVTDMGPKSWPGIHCILGLGLRASISFDIFHRLHGDWLGAVSYAQLSTTKTDFRHVLHLWHGPCASGGHGGKLHELATKMGRVSNSDNPIFLTLFDHICRELHLDNVSNYGEKDHIDHVWRQLLVVLQQRPTFETKHARWFSFEGKALRMQECLGCSPLLCVLLWYGWLKGFWKTWSELPLAGDRAVAAAVDDEAGDDVEDPNGGDMDTPAAADLSGGVKAKHMQLAARILSNPLSSRLFHGLAHLPRDFILGFGEVMEEHRTPRGTEHCMQAMSEGRLMSLAFSFLDTLIDPKFAAKVGMHMEMSDYCINDDKVAGSMFAVAFAACGSVMVTSLNYSHMLPHALLRLRTGDVAKQAEVVDWLRDVWTSVRKLECDAGVSGDAEMRAFLRDLRFPQQLWTRELMLELEASGYVLTDSLRTALHGFGRGLHSTLLVENSFRQARSSERSASGLHGALKNLV